MDTVRTTERLIHHIQSKKAQIKRQRNLINPHGVECEDARITEKIRLAREKSRHKKKRKASKTFLAVLREINLGRLTPEDKAAADIVVKQNAFAFKSQGRWDRPGRRI
jgi:predicted methyltransferase MtxX (methanogen marker protein 4)